jgi:hypothetical protein
MSDEGRIVRISADNDEIDHANHTIAFPGAPGARYFRFPGPQYGSGR